jgi:hypothetical protein
MKDVEVFPKNIFGDMVMEKMTGLKYWRIMKTKIMNEKKIQILRMGFCVPAR